MSKFLKLAWRNIWRNKRRSFITIAAITFAILMVAVMRSLQYGTYDAMESLAVRLYNGEIQIQHKGFHEEQSLTYHLKESGIDWQTLLAQNPELTAYSLRVTGFGLASSDSASTAALIVGVEPKKEAQITQFTEMVKTGRALQPGDDHLILIGTTMANNLQASPGDTIVVLTQGYRNQLGADSYVIKGLVGVGQPELDRNIMIMPLQNAQDLFSLYDGITQAVFRTVDFRKADQYSKQISNELHDKEYAVFSWDDLMPELKQIILVDNVSGAIYLAFLLIVVGFEIFNTTMMSVMERTREFGILQSIGMKPRQISGLIFFESFLKIFISLVVGLLISFLVIFLLTQHPIPLSESLKEAYASYGFALENITFSGKLRVYLEPMIAIAIIAVVALFFPLYKTVKLTPMEAFRKT